MDNEQQPYMIIQALKKMKSLKEEIENIRQLLASHCADYANESPVYETVEKQKLQISSWLQSIEDKLQAYAQLSLRVKYTNLTTPVTIYLEDGAKKLTLPLEEWIVMRREIAPIKQTVYASIGDRSLRDKEVRTSTGSTETVQVRRYYDPVQRDKALMAAKSLPSIIDSHLEVVNATTPLLSLDLILWQNNM
jgi:hypothetical protein